MTSDPRDQQSGPEFEQDLETVSAAWSGLEQTEPPELLNQAVLNTARRECDARRKSRPLRWLGGFATATVIVLVKKTDGFMLEQAAPEASKKEADRSDLEAKAGRTQASRPLNISSDKASETRMKRSAAAPPVAASDTAALPVAEEMSDCCSCGTPSKTRNWSRS